MWCVACGKCQFVGHLHVTLIILFDFHLMLQISCWLDALPEPPLGSSFQKRTTPYYNSILLAWSFEHFRGSSSTLITFESNTWNFVRKTYRKSTKINVKEISGRCEVEEEGEWNEMEVKTKCRKWQSGRRRTLLAITKCRLAIMTACYKLLQHTLRRMKS